MSEMLKKTDYKSIENGMTLDELRYNRALVYMKSEMLKEQMVRDSSQAFSGISSVIGGGDFYGRLMTGMNYLQYAVSGYRMFKKISKLFRGSRQNSD